MAGKVRDAAMRRTYPGPSAPLRFAQVAQDDELNGARDANAWSGWAGFVYSRSGEMTFSLKMTCGMSRQ